MTQQPFFRHFSCACQAQNIIAIVPMFFFGSSISDKHVNPKNDVHVAAVYTCV